jgi:hypothetical protein
MRIPLKVFQEIAAYAPADAAALLDSADEARYALTEPGVLPVVVAARMLPHCVERFPGLAGGAFFLDDDKVDAILRFATGQRETPGHSALSLGEATHIFASFSPQHIPAWRQIESVLEEEQQRLDDILSEACRSNVPQAIGALVAAAARLQVDERGETAAHAAARAGHERVMPALLASGIPLPEVMRVNSVGGTPLTEAMRNGHVRVIQALLEAGVGEQAVMLLDHDDQHAYTLAHGAVAFEQPQWIETLRAAGISPGALMAPDNEGSTPAHHAAERGNTDVIAALLEAGVSPRALMRADANGDTPAANAAPETLRAMRDLGIPGYLLVVPQRHPRRAGPELTP